MTTNIATDLGIKTKFLGQIPIEEIVESKANPRRDFGDLNDLAASIKASGVLSPIMVRISDGPYELVYGARRVRAAKQAGLTSIPAIQAECSDEEANAIRIIENGQRADVHPLHEAQAMQNLLNKGSPFDLVAARLGRPVAYVQRRLSLLLLPKPAQTAFLDGQMVLGVAQLIAGIGTESSRIRAWETIAQYDGCLTDPAAAREEIRGSVLPELDGATWKLSEEGIAGAVSCMRCPTRTAAQVDLFGSAKGSGHCLEPKCFQAKTDAAYVAAEKAFQASGQGTVLTPKECKLLFPYGGDRPKHEWIAASDTHWTGSKSVGVSVIMKGKEEKRFLAKGPDGQAIILYRRRDVEGGQKKESKKSGKQLEAAAKERREEALDDFIDEFIGDRMREAARELAPAEFIAFVGSEIIRGETGFEHEPMAKSHIGLAWKRHDVPNLKAWKASAEIVKHRIYRDIIFGRNIDTGLTFDEELKHTLPVLGLSLASLKKDAEKAFAQAEKAKLDEKPAAAAAKPRKGKKR